MAYLGRHEIDDLLTFPANTHTAATGAATDADSVPSYRVYEDETTTPILTGSMALLDGSNTVGLYSEQITLSAANGFEVGKCYTIYISATVATVVGTMAHTFQVEAAPATATALATVDGNVDTLVASITTVDAVADAVWDEASAGHVTAGSFGEQVKTDIDAILVDTNELQTDWVNGGRLDLLIDAIKAVTDALPQGGALTTLLANVAAILADTGTDGVVLSTAVQDAIADAVLSRGVSNVQDTADTTSLAAVILATFESAMVGTTWTIRKTGGTTFMTKTLTVDAAADSVIGVT